MRLVSISANQDSFKKIDFNSSGASFIIAEQKDPTQSDKKKTYNGVGKSLLVALIDFCLGASAGSDITKALISCDALQDWRFTLKLSIKGKPYIITRSVDNHTSIEMNDETLKLTEFHQRMQELCFDIEEDLKYLTFRSLLPFFLRPSKTSYTRYDEPQKFGTPYQKLLCNTFLLGLDAILADKKKALKDQLTERRNNLKGIEKDPIIREFFGHNQNVSEDYLLLLTDIEERIKKLEEDLQDYRVAKDYYQRQEEADQLKKLIDEKQKQIYLHKSTIGRINQSLRVEVDIEQKDIKKIYEESKKVFQDAVEKRLSDLEKFYADLKTNRTKRLAEQKRSIMDELEKLEEEATKLQEQFDEALAFLGSHGALDVFVQKNKLLSELKQKREKLVSYEKFQKKYKKEIKKLEQGLINENSKTIDYLEKNKSFLESINKDFRALAKKFYPNGLAGITIVNNEGENQIRYNIEAKIQSDSSDGINSVKLFCYDLCMLFGGNNHHMNFIFHDSRLFSDIDETHCEVLFDIVRNKFKTKQYIASINQKDLKTLAEPIQDFIRQNMVCELNDESEEGKLLGRQVELEYD